MPKLTIDSQEIEVPQGMKVLQAAEWLGIIIPRFCYHPALGSCGACRVCAVKFQEGPVKGVQMSCMIEAQEGMVVSTNDPEAVDFRKQVIEWLMMNHPHDCPVCDEGGHCLLQDLTIAGGHGIRRYPGEKRTFRDQNLGTFVQHEMNRCIHCYRCRRFYQEFAGYRDLGCLQIAYRTYFGRFQDGPLESPFSGNLIDICPTGVFTDKPSRYTGRRWDFQRSPSLCIHCGLGCNTVSSARYRKMVRQEARFHKAVNGYFICDRGRYGFSHTYHPQRPRRAEVNGKETPLKEAIHLAVENILRLGKDCGPGFIRCLGSTRSSLENQGMLKWLCRTRQWEEPRYFETPDLARKVKKATSRLNTRNAVSMREMEAADFILAVGADPVNEAPMLALAMRQSFRNGGISAVLDPRPVFLPFAFEHLPLTPHEINLGLNSLMKRVVDRSSVASLGAEILKYYDALPAETSFPGGFENRFHLIEEKLRRSRKPVIVCGLDIIDESTIDLAANSAILLQESKGHAGLFYLMSRANTYGAALLSTQDGSLRQIIEGIEQGQVHALLVVENDPFHFYPDRAKLESALAKLDFLLVLDYLPSQVSRQAHIFLPTSTVFETGGSFVNQEGRLQFAEVVLSGGLPLEQVSGGDHPPRIFEADIPGGEPQPAWLLLAELAEGLSPPITSSQALENLWRWMAQENPRLAGWPSVAGVAEGFRILPDSKKEIFFPPLPSPFRNEAKQESDSLELLLVDWTFGTEEISGYSHLIHPAEKKPQLYMQTRDAVKAGLKDQERVILQLESGSLEVQLGVVSNMAPGILVLPRHRQLKWQILKETPVKITLDQIKKKSAMGLPI